MYIPRVPAEALANRGETKKQKRHNALASPFHFLSNHESASIGVFFVVVMCHVAGVFGELGETEEPNGTPKVLCMLC